MKSSNLSSISKIALLTILLLSFSTTSYSQWVSQPVDAGMSTGTVILIGVGVAAAVTAIILIANSSSDDSTEAEQNVSEKKLIEQTNKGVINSLIQNNLKNKYSGYKNEEIPFNIYLNVMQNKFQLSANTYEIGVAFNF